MAQLVFGTCFAVGKMLAFVAFIESRPSKATHVKHEDGIPLLGKGCMHVGVVSRVFRAPGTLDEDEDGRRVVRLVHSSVELGFLRTGKLRSYGWRHNNNGAKKAHNAGYAI
jgi:hypothetical protein